MGLVDPRTYNLAGLLVINHHFQYLFSLKKKGLLLRSHVTSCVSVDILITMASSSIKLT